LPKGELSWMKWGTSVGEALRECRLDEQAVEPYQLASAEFRNALIEELLCLGLQLNAAPRGRVVEVALA